MERVSLLTKYKQSLRNNLLDVDSIFEEYQSVDAIHELLEKTLLKDQSGLANGLFALNKEIYLLQRILKVKKVSHLTIYAPFYNSMETFFRDYSILFSLLANIYEQLKSATPTSWKGEEDLFTIFDPFLGKSSFLACSGLADGQLIFGNEEIFADTDNFLPLFYKEEVSALKEFDRKLIRTLFNSIIRLGKNLNIKHPVVLSLKSNKVVVLTGSKKPISAHPLVNTDVSIDGILYDCINNGIDREQVQEQLRKNTPKTIIQLEWPYHRFDEQLYLRILRPQNSLKLKFQKRYTLRLSNDVKNVLYILPNELTDTNGFYDYSNINQILCPVPTTRIKTLLPLLERLKERWREMEKGVFTCPFPSKWLMLIHPDKDLEYWQRSYWDTFPAAPSSMRNDIESIIKHIWEENWLEAAISKVREKGYSEIKIILPQGNSYRSINEEFKSFMSKRLNGTLLTYIDHQDLLNGKESGLVWVLNTSWNILFNLPVSKTQELLIVVPDFHYMQSLLYTKAKMLKETKDNLLGENDGNPSIRQKLLSREQVEELNSLYILEMRAALKEAKLLAQAYKIETPDEEIEDIIERLHDTVDDRLNQEELDIHERQERFYIARELERGAVEELLPDEDEKHLIEITTLNNVLQLKTNTPVLIRHEGIVMNAFAGDINPGDIFIPYAKVFSSFELADNLFRSWTKHPEIVKDWKGKLAVLQEKKLGAYEMVKALVVGKAFIQERRFKSEWLDPNSDMLLPRERNHWNAVCDLLNVDFNQKKLAWISVRCDQKVEEASWRRVKKRIIDAMVDERYLGRTRDQEATNRVTSFLTEELGAHLVKNEIEAKDLTRALFDDLEHILLNDEIKFETALIVE